MLQLPPSIMSSRTEYLIMCGTANKVNQHCQRWAKLVQAYIACPSAVEEQVKTGKLRLPCVLNALDDLQPAEAAFMCVTK